MDIRKYIINNFKDSNKEDINSSIIESMNNKEEITLPGLGVFFEVLWNNSDNDLKNKILNILKENMNN